MRISTYLILLTLALAGPVPAQTGSDPVPARTESDPVPAQSESDSAAETAFIPLFKTTDYQFRGPLPSAEFFFRIPEHIKLVEGSELVLKFKASPLLIADVSTATVTVNGSPVTSLRLPGEVSAGDAAAATQTVRVALEISSLKTGWNRVTVGCLLQTTIEHCRDIDNPACWFSPE